MIRLPPRGCRWPSESLDQDRGVEAATQRSAPTGDSSRVSEKSGSRRRRSGGSSSTGANVGSDIGNLNVTVVKVPRVSFTPKLRDIFSRGRCRESLLHHCRQAVSRATSAVQRRHGQIVWRAGLRAPPSELAASPFSSKNRLIHFIRSAPCAASGSRCSCVRTFQGNSLSG
jgi:hypothetical protein